MTDALELREDRAVNKALWLDHLCHQIATETGDTPAFALQLLLAGGDLGGLIQTWERTEYRARSDTPIVKQAPDPPYLGGQLPG